MAEGAGGFDYRLVAVAQLLPLGEDGVDPYAVAYAPLGWGGPSFDKLRMIFVGFRMIFVGFRMILGGRRVVLGGFRMILGGLGGLGQAAGH